MRFCIYIYIIKTKLQAIEKEIKYLSFYIIFNLGIFFKFYK
jgi:hypothetical protein